MGEYGSAQLSHEMEQHIVAAAEHIIMALKACTNLSDDARGIICDLQTRLQAKPELRGRKADFLKEMEEILKRSEKVIMSWEMSQSMVWDSGPTEGHQYLEAVVEIQRLMETLGNISLVRNFKQKELHLRASGMLEIAMTRLEEEVKFILSRYKQHYKPECMSFRSHVAYLAYDDSYNSTPANSPPQAVNEAVSMEENTVDLVQPDMIPVLKSIAKVMFDSDHGQEFCRTFTNWRRDALQEYLTVLELKQLTIEEIMKLDWDKLSYEMKNWVWAMKIIVQVYLASERNMCNQILGEFGEIISITFLEIAKSPMLLLLNFGEAIVMSPHQPEKLFRILDMYEVLAHLLVDIDALFSEEDCSFIRFDFHDLLAQLGVYIRATFSEFRDGVESNRSQKPFTKGGVHPLTSYVMNYIRTLCAYRATFNMLFRDEQVCFMDPSLAPENIADDPSFLSSCPLERHLRSILSVLEVNLDEKSKLFRENALQHIFLMNNMCYMVDKVKDSDDLRLCFGDEWIRKHIGMYQQHATSYLRATWSRALSILLESGSSGSSSSNNRTSFREKCKTFCAVFEEVYKCQTGWVVQNSQLRSGLQITTSQKVIPAYWTFLGKHENDIGDKYIKYTADDLEALILDLFEGSTRSLPRSNSRRK